MHNAFISLREWLSSQIIGQPKLVDRLLIAVLADGHLLVEDLPGMGKTTLAHALYKVLGLDYNRMQFTSDLLPSDLIGASVFNAQTSSFSFHKGPIFTPNLVEEIRSTKSSKTSVMSDKTYFTFQVFNQLLEDFTTCRYNSGRTVAFISHMDSACHSPSRLTTPLNAQACSRCSTVLLVGIWTSLWSIKLCMTKLKPLT